MHSNLADVFEYFIEKGGHWEVLYSDHSADRVSFKDIYLYTTGINISYFSWNKGTLKTSLFEAFWKIEGKTLEEWLEVLEAQRKPKPSKRTKKKATLEGGGAKSSRQNSIGVAELTMKIKKDLRQSYRNIWVRGEVSNATPNRNGNLYFSLKDEEAVLHCILFGEESLLYASSVQEGMEVSVLGTISVYPKRGTYQCIAQMVLSEQRGVLASRFDELKSKLASEGLFLQERKKPIPRYPKRVGLITSPEGAVVHDVLKVLALNDVFVEIFVYPVAVQGVWAPNEMVRMLKTAHQHDCVDLIVIGRGGGSQEDLSAFNDEELVRVVAGSRLPIVSAVGHETDVSLVDFAADFYCPTPTAAAEFLSSPQKELRSQMPVLRRRLGIQLAHRLERSRDRVLFLSPKKFQHALEEWVLSLKVACFERRELLATSIQSRLERWSFGLKALDGRLRALSPEATLARGFSVVRKGDKIITQSKGLRPEDLLELSMHEGAAEVRVVATKKPPKPKP